MDKGTLETIEAPIIEAPIEIRNIIIKVLKAEKDKLYLDRPRIVDDIVDIIKGEIKL